MAYILIIQIFLLNFFLIGSKLKRTLFILFINSVSIFSIFGIFQTRSAILTLIFLYLVTCITLVYLKVFKDLKIKETLSGLLIKCFIPLIFGILITNYVSNKYDFINIQDRLATVSNYSEDTSLSQRLRYYKAAFESFKKYPIHGIGIGGWEIESVKYESLFLTDFVVPYHAHNDYLETIAETGLIGFILFYGSIFYLFFLTIKNIFFRDKSENKIFLFFVLVALTSYLIDSLFNFPYDRTFQQIYLFFLLSILINFVQSPIAKFNIFKVDKILILFLIILFPASLYSSIRSFNASKDHATLLAQFNRNDFSKPSLEDIDSFEMTYPNITPTALSMNSIKGLFYMRNGKYRDAIKYFKKGIKSSPHMYLSEYGIGVSYLMLNMPDSALYYSRKAFKSTPNNYNYFATYAASLIDSKDSIEIKSA
ncbi:MAG: O-antigen ligase family protein, partial [Alphaproteobacteria bacterium]|nr:O-antigen ligase family protein [Alphaproteobacteria bacterium]